MTAPFTSAALEPDAAAPLILALPKGRILSECGQLLSRAGVNPAPDYADEDSRRLRFPTDDPMLNGTPSEPTPWYRSAKLWVLGSCGLVSLVAAGIAFGGRRERT